MAMTLEKFINHNKKDPEINRFSRLISIIGFEEKNNKLSFNNEYHIFLYKTEISYHYFKIEFFENKTFVNKKFIMDINDYLSKEFKNIIRKYKIGLLELN